MDERFMKDRIAELESDRRNAERAFVALRDCDSRDVRKKIIDDYFQKRSKRSMVRAI